MPDRLSALDVSFLYLEERATPMHVGGVAVFDSPAEGFDHADLVSLIRERIAFVPRYRKRLRAVPGRVANPVWVDDEHFDLTYHVRRSALPRPGSDEQLHELVARVQSRPLDRRRPLWEVYLVEGLAENRFALITKTHQAMIDGVSGVDLTQAILDPTPDVPHAPHDAWRPAPEPSWFELIAGGIADTASRPGVLLESVRGGFTDVRHAGEKALGALAGLFSVVSKVVRPPAVAPLNVPIGQQRRFSTVDTDLADYKRVRRAHGGSVNDVVLTAVTGALRDWLLTRGLPVSGPDVVRALVPVSVRSGEHHDTLTIGDRVASYVVDLPVGEPNPVMRLHRVSYAMKAHQDTGRAVAADALAGLAGFAPPTLHALGARAASGLSSRVFNLVITNAPGPQAPLYAGSARLRAAYPVVPLARTQALSVGVTSYDGRVFYGLNADRDAVGDLDVLAQSLREALAELLETV